MKYFVDLFKGISTLWAGMRITGKYFISPRSIVTQKYPENRKTLQMFDRFKGEVILLHDENNLHACTGCGICEMNCPNGSIQVLTNRVANAEGKMERVLDKYVYHLSMCTFCGLCVKTCPSKALGFSQKFEHAVFDRNKLTKVLNKPGSSLRKEAKQ